MSIADALERARVAELDLVEVASQADPPVCRIMDYGKFRYEESQKLKESRKNRPDCEMPVPNAVVITPATGLTLALLSYASGVASYLWR